MVGREVWRNIRMKNSSTSVTARGLSYGLDESIMRPRRGDWRRKMEAPLWLRPGGPGQRASDRADRVGELALVRATRESSELASGPPIEGKTWNHPALSDGYLLIRNGRRDTI